jgi:hypothetical protein
LTFLRDVGRGRRSALGLTSVDVFTDVDCAASLGSGPPTSRLAACSLRFAIGSFRRDVFRVFPCNGSRMDSAHGLPSVAQRPAPAYGCRHGSFLGDVARGNTTLRTGKVMICAILLRKLSLAA